MSFFDDEVSFSVNPIQIAVLVVVAVVLYKYVLKHG